MRSFMRTAMVSMATVTTLDGLGGGHEALREGRQLAAGADGLGATVGRGADGGDALGHAVGRQAGEVDDLVELQVHGAELRADHVPVGLLAQQRQVDQLDEGGLQVLDDGGVGGHGASFA